MIQYRSAIGLFFGIFGLLAILTGWIGSDQSSLRWARWPAADRVIYVENWNSRIEIGKATFITPLSKGTYVQPWHGHLTLGPWTGVREHFPAPGLKKTHDEIGEYPGDRTVLEIPYWLILLCYPLPCYLLHRFLLKRQRAMRAKLPSLLPGDGGAPEASSAG